MGFHRMHDRLVRVYFSLLLLLFIIIFVFVKYEYQLDDTGEILLWCDPYATPTERNETSQTNSIPITSIISVKAGK